MRLMDLSPRWRAEYRDRELTLDRGGIATGNYDLDFTCPTCGPPYRIIIKIGATADSAVPRWMASPMPGGPDWPERVTITPSIDNSKAGHGRNSVCRFHGHITLGEIIKAERSP
jgi:hypothetical protein